VECRRVAQIKHYEENREAKAAYQRRWRAEHRRECEARKRKWYEDNKEAIALRRRRFLERNRAAQAARMRKWHEDNREASLAYYRKRNEEFKAKYGIDRSTHYRRLKKQKEQQCAI
jgi:hypothetical protein